jgi:hypothetical protein
MTERPDAQQNSLTEFLGTLVNIMLAVVRIFLHSAIGSLLHGSFSGPPPSLDLVRWSLDAAFTAGIRLATNKFWAAHLEHASLLITL